MKNRIALRLSYDGTNYAGWQRQKNAVTVQEVVEAALLKLTGEQITIAGASRTDAGVHASGQVAHFDTASSIPGDRFCLALNTFLPPDIRVMSSTQADADFHSRFNAVRKTYRYTICNAPVAHALYNNRAWHVRPPLDTNAMRKAAESLIGEHDFAAFRAAGGQPVRSTVRRVEHVELQLPSPDENLLNLVITGSGFLYNMVRIIAGTLVYVGMGKLPPDVISQMIATKNRKLGGPTAPPQGLILCSVEYPNGGLP